MILNGLAIDYMRVMQELTYEYLLTEDDFRNLYYYIESQRMNDIANLLNSINYWGSQIRYARSIREFEDMRRYEKEKREMEQIMLIKMRDVLAEMYPDIPSFQNPFR